MLEYFPGNYTWSLAASLAIGMGGQPSEVESACARLRDRTFDDHQRAATAWAKAWGDLGDRLASLAGDDHKRGYAASASDKYLRAAAYYFAGERMLAPGSAKRAIYERGLEVFGHGVTLSGRRVEFVEVPFEGGAMPALFLPAAGPGERTPAMIHLDGFDVFKEILYLNDAPGYQRRGVSVLIVDHPGVGEALRLRNMPLRYDMEAPTTACFEYLAGRADIDEERIGVVGISLGGYFAPRAAAYETRLACCVCWGAMYDTAAVVEHMASGGAESVPDFAMAWVTGADDPGEIKSRVARLNLRGVMQDVRCPLLVVHGEQDHQVPLEQAQRTYDEAVNSPRRELRVFTEQTGGERHCQVDNQTLATQAIQDWVAEVLAPRPVTAPGVVVGG